MEAIKEGMGESEEKQVAGSMEQPGDLHVQVLGFLENLYYNIET